VDQKCGEAGDGTGERRPIVDDWVLSSERGKLSAKFYGEDLAYVHHEVCRGYSLGAAPWLLRSLRRAGIREGTLVDLGCGSGLWARVAAQAGFNVIGVDISPAMVRLAKRVAPRCDFRCAAAAEFDFPPCAAVTAVGEALNYLHGKGGGRPDLASLFRRIARALRPGGLLMFDMILREGGPMKYRTWQEGKDWAVLVEVNEDRTKSVLVRRTTAFRKVGTGYRRSAETHRLWLPSLDEVGGLLRKAGFVCQARRSYGSFRLPPRRWAFISRIR